MIAIRPCGHQMIGLLLRFTSRSYSAGELNAETLVEVWLTDSGSVGEPTIPEGIANAAFQWLYPAHASQAHPFSLSQVKPWWTRRANENVAIGLDPTLNGGPSAGCDLDLDFTNESVGGSIVRYGHPVPIKVRWDEVIVNATVEISRTAKEYQLDPLDASVAIDDLPAPVAEAAGDGTASSYLDRVRIVTPLSSSW